MRTIWQADDPQYPDRLREDTVLEIKMLSEDGWHLRIVKRPSGKKQILAHFHGTVSHLVWPNIGGLFHPDALMRCIMCKQTPPEAIQMVLNLQKLKGKV